MATQTYTSAYGGLTLEAVCTYTENAASNNSTVSVTLNLKHGEFYASALSGSYLSVAGVKKTYTKNISWSGGNTTSALTSQTVTVAHNADGTGSCRIIGTFVLNGSYGSTSIGTMTIDKTLTLPKIPRASTLSAPTSATTGSKLTVTITPANTSFTHKLQYKVGATIFDTVSLSAGTTSYSYDIPHSWLSTSTSNTLVVLLSTYSGDTEVGSMYKLVSLSVPSTDATKPSISSLTATSSVTTDTFANLHVQGKSAVILSASASAGSGASIVSYTFSGPDISSVVTSSETSATLTTGTLKSSGSLTYKVTVKDSRGLTAEKTVTIYSQPYASPTISYVSVQRCDANGNLSDSGTYAKYTVNSTYSNVDGKNTRTVTVAYSSNGGTSYSAETTLQAATDTTNSKTGVYGGGVFALASTYVIRFTIKDAYGATKTANAPLQSAARPININSTGKGVAIGGMSTKNAFEVSMDADFNKSVNIDGTTTINNTLTTNGGIDAKGSIRMGGLNGQTGELSIMFSNPTTSTCPHKTYFYGGAPNSETAIGCYDGLNSRTVWSYNDSTNVVNVGGYGATISFAGYKLADFVESQGASGDWTFRKWHSGIAECWRTISGNITKYTTWNNMHGYTGSAEFPSGFFTQAPNVQYQVDIGTGFTMPAQGASSTKDKFNWLALASDGTADVNYKIDVYAIGKWK